MTSAAPRAGRPLTKNSNGSRPPTTPATTVRNRVTLQATMHVLNAVGLRDPATGESLPDSLCDVLDAIEATTRTANRPIPADRIDQAVSLVLGSLEQIVGNAPDEGRPRTPTPPPSTSSASSTRDVSTRSDGSPVGPSARSSRDGRKRSAWCACLPSIPTKIASSAVSRGCSATSSTVAYERSQLGPTTHPTTPKAPRGSNVAGDSAMM